MKLTIEPLPNSWYSTLDFIIPGKMYNNLCVYINNKYNKKCSICNNIESHNYHAVWEYNIKYKTKILKDVVLLCDTCYAVKHVQDAVIYRDREHKSIAIKQLMRINKYTRKQAVAYINYIMFVLEERNKYKWNIDTAYLDQFN